MWGPEIKLDPAGVRPAWLKDEDRVLWTCVGPHYGPELQAADLFSKAVNFHNPVIAIKLPADHWAYKAIERGFEPWGGGAEAPTDWDGRWFLYRKGEVVDAIRVGRPCFKHQYDALDVIGYRKKAEPKSFWAYKAIKHGFEPWGGGFEPPADWDEGCTLRANGEISNTLAQSNGWLLDPGPVFNGGAARRIIGYRKKAEPKPFVVNDGEQFCVDGRLWQGRKMPGNPTRQMVNERGEILHRLTSIRDDQQSLDARWFREAELIGNRVTPVPSEPDPASTLTPDQVDHMVQRFLQWFLPDDFAPDGGISFEPWINPMMSGLQRRQPTGTNLLTAAQATEMVRFMIDGMPAR